METHDYDDVRVLPELREQLGLALAPRDTYFSAPSIDLSEYQHIILGMSAGKDSLAALLRLLDMGVDRERIELWHHDVDGREGSTLMDWPFMADYNRKIAEAFEIPLYFSWLEGGLEGELCKQNAYSKCRFALSLVFKGLTDQQDAGTDEPKRCTTEPRGLVVFRNIPTESCIFATGYADSKRWRPWAPNCRGCFDRGCAWRPARAGIGWGLKTVA